MPRELKVYGFTAMNPDPSNGYGAQVRVLVRAHSVAEVLRLTGVTRATYNWTGCETANEHEVAFAQWSHEPAHYFRLNTTPSAGALHAGARPWPTPKAKEDSKRGRMQVSSPALQQMKAGMPYHAEAALAYEGLVPRTDLPSDDAWDARMAQRRALKEEIFHLAYGGNPKGHEQAATAMAEFNAETLRLFPERFREPTPEEVERRKAFARLFPLKPFTTSDVSDAALEEAQAKARIVRGPLPEGTTVHVYRTADEREQAAELIARTRRSMESFTPPVDFKVATVEEAQNGPVDSRGIVVPLTEAEEKHLARARRQQSDLRELIQNAQADAWDAAMNAAKDGVRIKVNHSNGGRYLSWADVEKNPFREAN